MTVDGLDRCSGDMRVLPVESESCARIMFFAALRYAISTATCSTALATGL
jgi:hypothetical protein